MKKYYCVELKFKDKRISEKTFHSHLYVSDKEMYFQIIDNELNSKIDRKFSISGALGLLKEKLEITRTEVSLFFDESIIYKMISFKTDNQNTYFTIYVSKIALIFPNKYKESINQGTAFLNGNGLKVVNRFYSFFSNFEDKNVFSISHMNDMSDFYETDKLTFRPELNFINNEKRGSEKFTIEKIPTISYQFKDLEFEQVKNKINIICNFLSFCFGIRVIADKIIFRTENNIVIYRDTSLTNKTFVSDFSVVFSLLENNYNIQRILKTKWFDKYVIKKDKFDKAIDNYLHSREVNLTASFLLLFNIIEIFNKKQKVEKFDFDNNKDINIEKAFDLISSSLTNENDKELLRDKWVGIKNKIELKPMKSPLEETLLSNNINALEFGYTFSRLKKTRDKLTHGSINSINEKSLKYQIHSLREITLSLILANLGLDKDLKKNAT
ncbi:hypothetical protein [Tenacibaculum piscium]|uniref:hypothetical protein n=1 Tax=Tenacibaculum piscium TaxID=1458515 RepID=UPI001F353EBE|nr:hypothetical protein [Tenacibaculum piscium]